MIDTSELDSAMEWLLSNLTFLEYAEKAFTTRNIYIQFYHKLHKYIVTYTIAYIYISYLLTYSMEQSPS